MTQAGEEPKCWRCGGIPHEHPRLKPRRPVCAECILELLTLALGDDDTPDEQRGDHMRDQAKDRQ